MASPLHPPRARLFVPFVRVAAPLAATSKDLLFAGIDLAGSVTRAGATILADANFPPAVGWAFHPYPQRTFIAETGYDL